MSVNILPLLTSISENNCKLTKVTDLSVHKILASVLELQLFLVELVGNKHKNRTNKFPKHKTRSTLKSKTKNFGKRNKEEIRQNPRQF